jgi:hypothetical protein
VSDTRKHGDQVATHACPPCAADLIRAEREQSCCELSRPSSNRSLAARQAAWDLLWRTLLEHELPLDGDEGELGEPMDRQSTG